tara:strand:+ start:327 stop:497 length:171 start_codon:yes stop_codon:yes gene_type:complete
MKVDRHHDPVSALEEELLQELQGITQQLGGTMEKSLRCDSTGRQSKIITIEYNVEE